MVECPRQGALAQGKKSGNNNHNILVSSVVSVYDGLFHSLSSRCMDVLNGKKQELFPVALGITDDDGKYHLIEASRTLSRQLHLWSKSISCVGVEVPVISEIASLTLTHHHLGHIDGIGLFGKEVMGKPQKSIRLIAGKAVIDKLEAKSYLDPFYTDVISNSSKIKLGRGVSLEFYRVPHRECEKRETYGIVVRGNERSIFFLPDHDSYEETLAYQNKESIRDWLHNLNVDVVLIDGTFFTLEEISVKRIDSKGIPHPTISESLEKLGKRNEKDDPEIFFIHLNHTNPVIDDVNKRHQIEKLGWGIGKQGQSWTIG